jgi:hypothetical protein
MPVHNLLLISIVVSFGFGMTSAAQESMSTDVPPGLIFTYTPKTSETGVEAVLVNKTDKPLAAYVYEGTCPTGALHTRGHVDSAGTYTVMLSPGDSRSVAAIDRGCTLAVTAGVFYDGTEFGDPKEIMYIYRHRHIADIELKSVLTECYQAKGETKLDLDILSRVVKMHRDTLPDVSREPEERTFEKLTRKHVLDRLDFMVAFFARYPPKSDTMRLAQIESLQFVTTSWVAALERKTYPKTRVRLDAGLGHD